MRILSTVAPLAICFCFAGAYAEQVNLTVLATTDLHGSIFPTDYYTGHPEARGLAKLATRIREVRAQNPNTLLIDCGDTIQGSPLEYVYQSFVRTGRFPLNLAIPSAPFARDPMMLVMNHIGYDAMVVGNHEFNFGLKNLERARRDARFPWIAANIEVAPEGPDRPFAPYLVKTLAGVKIAVIGITTPAIPSFEKSENLGSYRFVPGNQSVRRAMTALRQRERPNLVLVAAHSGLGRDLNSGRSPNRSDSVENEVYEIATQIEDIDAIVFGHTHQELAGYRLGKVLLVQPKNWGISLARIDFVLEGSPGTTWKLTDKTSRLIPASESTVPDDEVLRLARPFHEAAERYLNAPVADSPHALDGSLGRLEDTALVDAIQEVQLHYSKADVSFTSLFSTSVKIPKGPVTVRQIAALYVYDNELYAVEGDGKMVKDALENSARYFLSCRDRACSQGPLINPRVFGFNYDMAKGVEYAIDLSRPEGERIRDLRWNGQLLAPQQKLRVAVNSYRAAGSAGYGMFKGAKILWRSYEEIRELIIRHYVERKQLLAEPDGNWHILPPQALLTLKREVLAEANRGNLF